MKKILLAMALSLSFAGASHATDEFIKETLKYCSSKGGTSKIEKTTQTANKECFKILCYKAVGVSDVDFNGSIDEIRSKLTGAGAAVLAFEPNACRDYKEPTVDDLINNGSTTNGTNNGSTTNGTNNGSTTNGTNNGSTTNGTNNGSTTNGTNNGSTGVDVNGGIRCEFVLSGTLSSSHPCLKACKKNFWGKEGIERKKCRECIEKYSTENGGDLVVDWDAIVRAGGKKPNQSTIKVTGVQVRTGEIVCYDVKTGAVVTRIGTGSVCPSGSSTTPGGVVIAGSTTVGSTNGSNGTVIINANTGGTGSVGQLPSYCYTGKKADQKKCDAYIANTARFACASGGNIQGCIGGSYNDIQSRYNYDGCINCGPSQRKDNSWIGEAISGGLHAVATGLTGYWGAKAYEKGQVAWANAAATGFEQCQINNNNYLQYTHANELGAVSPEQFAAMGCNGFQLSGYGGLGWGGMGGWLGAGYTPGFLGGYMGPYGGYNPYGMGGIVGGAVGGMYAGGYAGGYVAGMQGGMVGGMVNGAVAGGYVAGGMAAGYPGGYVAGGYVAGGMAAGYPGGYAAGYNAGMAGGLIGGIQIAGGIAAGYPGGYMAGGYMAGGYAAGMAGGYVAGGYMAGGYMAGGYMAGGYTGGYYPGGYYPGGWGSGTGQWGAQGNYWQASQQTAAYDQMLQGQGLSYQMNGYGGGYGGGYNAGYYPGNLGGSFGVQLYGGLSGW